MGMGTNSSDGIIEVGSTLTTTNTSVITQLPGVTSVSQDAANISDLLNSTTSINNTEITTLYPTTQHNYPTLTDDGNFFTHLTIKDESVFVALIVLGVVIPITFITILALICIRRQKARKARRAERLLRDVQEVALDDYPPGIYRIQSALAT